MCIRDSAVSATISEVQLLRSRKTWAIQRPRLHVRCILFYANVAPDYQSTHGTDQMMAANRVEGRLVTLTFVADIATSKLRDYRPGVLSFAEFLVVTCQLAVCATRLLWGTRSVCGQLLISVEVSSLGSREWHLTTSLRIVDKSWSCRDEVKGKYILWTSTIVNPATGQIDRQHFPCRIASLMPARFIFVYRRFVCCCFCVFIVINCYFITSKIS